MKQARFRVGKKALVCVAVAACLLAQLVVGVLPAGAADTDGSASILKGKSPTAKFIRHNFSWQDTYPEYEPADFDVKASQLPTVTNGLPGLGDVSHLTDGNTTDYGGEIMARNPSDHHIYVARKSLLYDLGDTYDLSQMKLYVANNYWVYSASVYGGNAADGTLFNNRIGIGGNESNTVEITLNTATPVRYVLIVFNKLGTDPGNANYAAPLSQYDVGDGSGYNGSKWPNGALKLSEIELFGTKVETKNILAGNQHYQTKRIRHNFNWDEALPDYSKDTMTDSGRLNGTNPPVQLTDGVTSGQRSGYDGTFDTWQEGEKAKYPYEYRNAILYELGGSYTLSEIKLYAGASPTWFSQVHQFSVFAGNEPDESLLSNRIGTDNSGKSTSKVDYDVMLDCDTPVKYVLIVFDKLSTDPGNKKFTSVLDGYDVGTTGNQWPGAGDASYIDGRWWLSEIEVYGVAAKEETLNNVLPKNTKVSGFVVKHGFSWDDPCPDYKAEDVASDYWNYNANSDSFGIFTDGDTATRHTDSIFAVNSPANERLYTVRTGLRYTLDQAYDLSRLVIHKVAGHAGYVYSVSVYGSKYNDIELIMANRIGTGGGKTDTVEVELTNAKGIQYIVIVFNLLGTDPGNRNHVAYAVGDNAHRAVPKAYKEQVGDGSAYEGVAWATGDIAQITEIELFDAPADDQTDALTGIGAGITNVLVDGKMGLRFNNTLRVQRVGDMDYVTDVDGKQWQVTKVGCLLAREDVLGDAKLLMNTAVKKQDLQVNSCRSCDPVADDEYLYTFSVLVKNVPQANKNTMISTRAYIDCVDTDGHICRLYGPVQSTSVQEMYDALGGSDEFGEDIANWMEG